MVKIREETEPDEPHVTSCTVSTGRAAAGAPGRVAVELVVPASR